jgi:hypothetical protein
MEPVTGVTNLNESANDWFWDCTNEGIEPAYEEARIDLIREYIEKSEGMQDASPEEIQEDAEDFADRELENWESDCMILVGDWVEVSKDRHGYPQYDVKKDGPSGWAGIYRREHGNILQVVYSKYAMMSRQCSLCYPGQADLDTPGDDYLGYCLPPEELDECYLKRHGSRIIKLEEDDHE